MQSWAWLSMDPYPVLVFDSLEVNRKLLKDNTKLVVGLIEQASEQALTKGIEEVRVGSVSRLITDKDGIDWSTCGGIVHPVDYCLEGNYSDARCQYLITQSNK